MAILYIILLKLFCYEANLQVFDILNLNTKCKNILLLFVYENGIIIVTSVRGSTHPYVRWRRNTSWQ